MRSVLYAIALSAVMFALPDSKTVLAQDSTANSEHAAKPDSPPANDAAKRDYSKEAFVVEQYKQRYRFESDGTGREENSARVRIQSESGVQVWGQLRFGYNAANERLEIPYVRVIKPDGSVVTAGPDAIQELTGPIQQIAPVYTDYREKHVTVPALRPGDVLESQTVTIIQTPLAPNQFWMSHDFVNDAVVLDEQLEIDVPSARAIKVKSKPELEPKTGDAGGRRVYRWSHSHLETKTESDDKDDKKEKEKKKKKKLDDVPDVQLTSFASWEEVGRWYASLEKDRRVPSKAVREKSEELTKGLSSDTEKIEVLYDYAAKNFRYVSLSLGKGRYQPHAADEVLHNQYGDCKDKNTLLAALLDAEGYHSSSVLINSSRKLDPDVPSPAQFDHVITMVSLGKDELWMDTTTEVAPFRLLAYALRKKQALVIPPEGVPHLEETPADPFVPNTEKLRINAKVDDSGKLDAQIAYEIRGDKEIPLRYTFRLVPKTRWQALIEETSTKEGLGKEVSEIKVSDPTATREPFTFSYRVIKPDYLDQSKKTLGLRLPLSVFGLENADPDDADNPEPIKLTPPSTRVYELRVEFPQKYTLRPPVPISVTRDYGTYQAIYKLEGRVLVAERKIVTNTSELPSARVQDYLAFRRAVAADLTQKLSLETTAAGTAAATSGLKASELEARGNAEMKNGNFTLAIDFLNRAIEAEPKSNMAWNDLGLAYFDSKQDGLAINAFQKQIEVNPYHPYAYNNLGRVYLRQRAYADAIKWFNKQIEVDPLDKYTHSNLGMAYLEQHKYADAVPELERAASLNPENAFAQVNLGEAYLNTDQDAKAMAAFDKATKISPTPLVWNDIGYQLSLKKVHLDLARQYAESAVTSTAAGLRNISLDTLTTRNLRLTSSLGSYWDTLGWVEFTDGRLDKAEKFVIAAWQLDQRGEVGDHLGQLYEKRGDTQKAAHYYALAMNATRPLAETADRLAAVAGGKEKADSLVEKTKGELLEQRQAKVANSSKLEGSAEFWLLFQNNSESRLVVEDVKFVSGDEKLKGMGVPIRAASYNQTLPDDSAIRIVRRGKLSCRASADCTFVLALPTDVHSVD